MNLWEKFSKNYKILQLIIVIFVIFIIIVSNIINFIFFQKSWILIGIDFIIGTIITVLIVKVTFNLIVKKEKQLQEQVDQLTEAYKYIGQINRKIDSLLELDISHLDHSKNFSLQETSQAILSQLISLLNGKIGYLRLRKPLDLNLHLHKEPLDDKIKNSLRKICHQGLKEFITSQNPVNAEKFIELGLAPQFLKKHHLIFKPVYMHDQDIGQLLIAIDKDIEITERDLNIIRVFSFYLALNAVFKPDFSAQKI